jgi:hypothetical protein
MKRGTAAGSKTVRMSPCIYGDMLAMLPLADNVLAPTPIITGLVPIGIRFAALCYKRCLQE